MPQLIQYAGYIPYNASQTCVIFSQVVAGFFVQFVSILFFLLTTSTISPKIRIAQANSAFFPSKKFSTSAITAPAFSRTTPTLSRVPGTVPVSQCSSSSPSPSLAQEARPSRSHRGGATMSMGTMTGVL